MVAYLLSNVGMKRTHVFLSEPAIKRLKQQSKQTGLSVSEIIRGAIERDKYFDANRQTHAILAAIKEHHLMKFMSYDSSA